MPDKRMLIEATALDGDCADGINASSTQSNEWMMIG